MVGSCHNIGAHVRADWRKELLFERAARMRHAMSMCNVATMRDRGIATPDTAANPSATPSGSVNKLNSTVVQMGRTRGRRCAQQHGAVEPALTQGGRRRRESPCRAAQRPPRGGEQHRRSCAAWRGPGAFREGRCRASSPGTLRRRPVRVLQPLSAASAASPEFHPPVIQAGHLLPAPRQRDSTRSTQPSAFSSTA